MATSSADVFHLPASSLVQGAYTTSISGFNVLEDHLQVPMGTALPQADGNVSVNSLTDGNVDLTWNNGNLVTIHLTGVANPQLEALLQAGTSFANSVVVGAFGTY